MTTTLHVISHSPFGDDRLSTCLRLLGTQDAVLLCGDATYALMPGSEPCQALLDAGVEGRLFALDEDLTARSLPREHGQPVDYPGFVELSLRFDKVNTWL
ncbi:sulfurtransferase complex subunit TusB [Pseudomonas sp. S75]|uniref:sulfurtransferase complex subunit TusB n=1 Tax=unclassified Pseudomonas TaxID=196821 RepID=UPI001905C677|nr:MULTISPECIES: sulfurtransferase complex subunit TusB [unclassified Pseudomonas]MBJ9976503.1 sulfurtransferase complex subunit TusB [Pseudomonas sp. S30]MBK0156297.1 sulfurtransferase complex subunit TusB [Pseudomonas sp. S75]